MVKSSSLLLPASSFLMYQPELAAKIGKTEAKILQYINSWNKSNNESIGKIHQGKRWIYNSAKAWAMLLGVSEKTVRRAIKKLEALGIILSDTLHDFKGNRTKWYTIVYDKFDALLSSFNLTKPSKSVPQKMSTWSGQNVRMYNKETKITSNTGLNSACAHETFQQEVEQKQREVVVAPSEETLSMEVATEEAYKALECVSTQLDKPLEISKPFLKNTIAKRMKTHFGVGKDGLERFREYLMTYASNAFLMGKKAMKSGDRFVTSVGSILSPKMIEDCWEGKGFFNVYREKQTKFIPQEEDDMGKRSTPEPLPPLTLGEALNSAQTALEKQFKKAIYQTFGEATYQSWFKNLKFSYERGKIFATPETAFQYDHLETNYRERFNTEGVTLQHPRGQYA